MDNRKFYHIKKFLSSLERVEIHESQNSIYYSIEFSNTRKIKIRLSDHCKKSVEETAKYDITITQPINNDKLWVVTTKNNLTFFLFTYAELKDFIKYYILMVKASRYNLLETSSEIESKAMQNITMGQYLHDNIKNYDMLSKSKRVAIRKFILDLMLPNNILKEYVAELNKSNIDYTIEKEKLIQKLSEVYNKIK